MLTFRCLFCSVTPQIHTVIQAILTSVTINPRASLPSFSSFLFLLVVCVCVCVFVYVLGRGYTPIHVCVGLRLLLGVYCIPSHLILWGRVSEPEAHFCQSSWPASKPLNSTCAQVLPVTPLLGLQTYANVANFIYIYPYIHIHTCIHMCMYACIYVYIYICVYMYILGIQFYMCSEDSILGPHAYTENIFFRCTIFKSPIHTLF